MNVRLTYGLVLIIWATTPLAIKWSNDSLDFILSVSLRMFLALGICIAILAVMQRKLFQGKSDWKVYLAGGMSFFPNMLLVYWSAQYIPSGLMAVLMGVYPFFVGVFSIVFLKENPFTVSRVFALLFAIFGLVFIHSGQMSLGEDALYGMWGILIAAIMFAASTVYLKKLGENVDPLRQLSGSLLFATPMFLLTWMVFGAALPTEISMKSVLSVAYLVIAGSILGGVGFFYIVKHCSVSTVSLIPLMTPIIALLVGYVFASEMVELPSIIGSLFIVFSLVIYQGMWRSVYKSAKRAF